MDDVFKDLEKAGKTDVENLIQWMKASKLIETAKDERVRKLFKEAADQQHVELAKFKEIVAKLAQEQSKTMEQVSKQLAAEAPKFIDAAIIGLQAFKEALRAAKLIESKKDDKVRKLFKEAGNQQRVQLAEFKKIVAKLADEQSRTLDQLSKQLAAEGPKVVDAALKGLHAFKDALKAGKF